MSCEMLAKEIPTLTYAEQIYLMSVLVEALKSRIPDRQSATGIDKNSNLNVADCTESYPKGYFDLFGSDPTYPDAPEDLSWDLEVSKEFF